MGKRRGVNAARSAQVDYPSWSASGSGRLDAPAEAHRPVTVFDPSRRRFLRQVGAGGAGICLGGLPALSSGRARAVELEILDRHMPVGASRPSAACPAKSGSSKPGTLDAGTDSAFCGGGRGDTRLASGEDVVEDRALWVEPGYLILLRWTRPFDDSAPVAALEAAGEAIAALLEQLAEGINDLHDIDRLHEIEREVVALLAPLVAPAEIEVLHLDHDCTLVCGGLEPRTPPETRPIMLGWYKPVGWK